MKNKLLILLIACLAPFYLNGCGTISKLYSVSTVTVSAKTSAELIVHAEQTIQIGKEAMDAFIQSERKNEAAFAKVSPKFHEYAQYLRAKVPYNPQGGAAMVIPRGVSWLKQAHAATMAFKANRTASNEANLNTAIKTVQTAIDNSRNYISAITTNP